MKFREFDTFVKSAAWNMASDNALLKSQYETRIPTLRFLSFEPCALVGYFQSVEQEIRTDYCIKKGIDINRRITGGGAIYFDPSQLGWEIIAPREIFKTTPERYYEIFGSSLAHALRKLGIKAEFKPRNDIEVNGRKISGMGGITYKDVFLFQGTLLVQDRIEEMLYSLRVPIEKLKPKEIESVRERVTCIEHELNNLPDREELKNVIRQSFANLLDISTVHAEMNDDEMQMTAQTLDYYNSPQWIHRIKLPTDTQGLITGTHRSHFGTIKVNMTVNSKQKMLRSTIITGDFFIEHPQTIFDLERLLKNIKLDQEKIILMVENFLKPFLDIPTKEFIKAFKETFAKWEWVKRGFTPTEANSLFAVNFSPKDTAKENKTAKTFSPQVFLFPYCAKSPECAYRYKPDCPICEGCTVGNGYQMAQELGLKSITIVNFEDLLEKFKYMRAKGVDAYVGSCCEAFYIKHQDEFRSSGLKGLLIDVKDSTCYDLGKAHEAYAGTFENQTNLNLSLIKKVIDYLKQS